MYNEGMEGYCSSSIALLSIVPWLFSTRVLLRRTDRENILVSCFESPWDRQSFDKRITYNYTQYTDSLETITDRLLPSRKSHCGVSEENKINQSSVPNSYIFSFYLYSYVFICYIRWFLLDTFSDIWSLAIPYIYIYIYIFHMNIDIELRHLCGLAIPNFMFYYWSANMQPILLLIELVVKHWK